MNIFKPIHNIYKNTSKPYFEPMVIFFILTGIHKLSSAMGIICIFLGCGIASGTPVAGRLRDVTGQWEMSFYFVAILLSISAILFSLKPLLPDTKQNNKEILTTKSNV